MRRLPHRASRTAPAPDGARAREGLRRPARGDRARPRRRRPRRRRPASSSVIVGASGCGKSTLLNIVGGLETATDGRGRGRRRAGRRARSRPRAWCSRRTRCIRGRRSRENIAFGLECAGMARRASGRERVDELLGIIGLTRVRRPPARAAVGRDAPAGRHRPGPRARSPTCSCSTSRSARSTRRRSAAMQDFLLHGLAAHRRHDPDGHPRRARRRST